MTEFTVRQAPDHLARRRVLTIAACSLAIGLLALAVAWGLLEHWGQPARTTASSPAPSTIGSLEQSLILDTDRGAQLLAKQRAELHEWGWVDADAGIGRVPIDVAVDILAASPLPVDRPLDAKARASKEAP